MSLKTEKKISLTSLDGHGPPLEASLCVLETLFFYLHSSHGNADSTEQLDETTPQVRQPGT